jgi:hypothetical protein
MSEIFTINLWFREFCFVYDVFGIISVYSAFSHLCEQFNDFNTKEYGLYFNNIEVGWYDSILDLKNANGEIHIKIKKYSSDVWRLKYSNGITSLEEKRRLQGKLLFYLNENSNGCNMASKVATASNMFDFLEEEGYKLLNECEDLMDVVKYKITEFHDQNPEMFSSLKPETKNFIKALSEIKCD